MTVCIARNKTTLTHYFFRLVRRDKAHDIEGTDSASLINALTSAKTHKQLAAAIENSCLLIEGTTSARQPQREMLPSECIELLERDFESVNPRQLAFEMLLATSTSVRANSSCDSPAADLDAFKCNFKDTLLNADSNQVALVEPVQDWMMCRNSLAVGAFLLAGIENPPQDGRVLERAGFFSPVKSNFDFPALVLPFKYHTAVWAKNYINHPFISDQIICTDVDYLYWLYLQNEKEAVPPRGVSGSALQSIGGDDCVFFATHYDATKKGLTPLDLLKVLNEWDRNIYLCVKMADIQPEMAKRVVKALWRKAQSIRSESGIPFGMSLDEESLFFPRQGTATFRHHSLNSKLWYDLCYHKNKRLIACKHCGCGVLASNRGPMKEYCSDSCRVQDRDRR